MPTMRLDGGQDDDESEDQLSIDQKDLDPVSEAPDLMLFKASFS